MPFSDIETCWRKAAGRLLEHRGPEGYWTGELSTSALSTATAVSALSLAGAAEHRELILPGIQWLAGNQNSDGGWGDTGRSISNISTTLLVRAAFQLAGQAGKHVGVLEKAEAYIQERGGFPAMRARYGKDKTFAMPILTNCALAGQVDWREVDPLPFELACLPHTWFQWLNLPVVSYALPALIAIGQVRHFHLPGRNPLTRLFRLLAKRKSLEVLKAIQPESGGYLEAAPLTSFVIMSLAGMGLADHPVARSGLRFLEESVRPDGSWPIDSNLSVWVTTLAVNALSAGGDFCERVEQLAGTPPDADRVRRWLLEQQFKQVHPYTHAAPGGWGWTHLPGSVPDADDTPGALLALRSLGVTSESTAAARQGARWLLDLQNRDGGWPTFCRGWGHLPFDRSGSDLTAHAIRALHAWQDDLPDLKREIAAAIRRGLHYLEREQFPEGYWLPLWFGNQFAPNDENRTYGTARVLLAYRDLVMMDSAPARRAKDWLFQNQNEDGGWGGIRGTESTIEETALALEALLPFQAENKQAIENALTWLTRAIQEGRLEEPAPIGFYFAKLWYYEKLYPLTFATSALARAATSR